MPAKRLFIWTFSCCDFCDCVSGRAWLGWIGMFLIFICILILLGTLKKTKTFNGLSLIRIVLKPSFIVDLNNENKINAGLWSFTSSSFALDLVETARNKMIRHGKRINNNLKHQFRLSNGCFITYSYLVWDRNSQTVKRSNFPGIDQEQMR